MVAVVPSVLVVVACSMAYSGVLLVVGDGTCWAVTAQPLKVNTIIPIIKSRYIGFSFP
jgi:hypothetical protein